MNELYMLKRYITGSTALHLQHYITEITGKRIARVNTPRDYAPIIRWGNSDGYFRDDTIYNSPKDIETCSSKIKMSRFLVSRNINCLEYYRDVVPQKYPIVVRQLIQAQGGKGIVIVKSYNEWLQYKNNWYSYFIPFTKEFRMHCLEGKPVKLYRKELIEGQNEDEYPIRNNDNKYHYKLKSFDYYKKLVSFCCNLAVFPQQMIGWDIGEYDNNYYVIEGNSAPSLNSINIPIYGDFLISKLF